MTVWVYTRHSWILDIPQKAFTSDQTIGWAFEERCSHYAVPRSGLLTVEWFISNPCINTRECHCCLEGARCSFVVRAFAHRTMGRRSLSYFSFHPVLHDWCNKGRGMCYPVCGVVHTKDPILLIGKSSPCNGGSGFPLSLSEWSFTICMTLYNRK